MGWSTMGGTCFLKFLFSLLASCILLAIADHVSQKMVAAKYRKFKALFALSLFAIMTAAALAGIWLVKATIINF